MISSAIPAIDGDSAEGSHPHFLSFLLQAMGTIPVSFVTISYFKEEEEKKKDAKTCNLIA